ncbi:MAG: YbjQ family protein [Candidatus Eisenbacteria bacterium]|nr:YbjQ family protein [Candidatus Eisenbacteria bacterium]
MIICTADAVPGHEAVECLGLVRGNTVRARHLGRDLVAGLRNLVGGEIDEYTKMLAEAREQALDRMAAEARRLGADGIVTVRFATSEVMQHAAEIVAYGTAVRLRKLSSDAARESGGGGR